MKDIMGGEYLPELQAPRLYARILRRMMVNIMSKLVYFRFSRDFRWTIKLESFVPEFEKYSKIDRNPPKKVEKYAILFDYY